MLVLALGHRGWILIDLHQCEDHHAVFNIQLPAANRGGE
jgi:hypothetical protein